MRLARSRRTLPTVTRTGTVTILFTDLVGSTALRTSIGEDAFDVVRTEHDRIIRDAVLAHEGEVVKHTGDGMMAAFAGTADAVSAVAAMQQGIA